MICRWWRRRRSGIPRDLVLPGVYAGCCTGPPVLPRPGGPVDDRNLVITIKDRPHDEVVAEIMAAINAPPRHP